MKTVPGRIVWIIGGFLVGVVVGAFIGPAFSIILGLIGAFLGNKLYYRAIKP